MSDPDEDERRAMAEASKMAMDEAREAQHLVKENDWEIPVNALMFDEKIGGGYFGEVFKGRFWGTDVAIKKIMQGLDKDDQILGDLRKEAAILASLRHPNVVLFMGLCSSPDVCIVTEYCPRGSLFDLLHDPDVSINFETMMKIAIGIAKGMTYLHNLKRKIIHRDLKSHNVLVGLDWTPKICDFGISHVRKRWRAGATMPGAKHYGVLGTPEWMAPEVLQGLAYDESADVYSYGIVLTELLTRQMPFRDKYQIFDYMDVVSCVLDDGAVPTIPAWASDETRRLIEGCVHRQVERRPNFVQIIETLNYILAQYSHEDIFRTYDVKRIRNMLESSRTSANMLAARELGEIQGTVDGPLVDGDSMVQFVGRLTELLGYWNPQLQLVVCESLIQILIHSEYGDQYLDIIVDGQGHEELTQVVETYTGSGEEEELLTKCHKLLNLLQNKLEARTETESVMDDEEHCTKCDALREIINGKQAKFCANCGNMYNTQNEKEEAAESIRTLFAHLDIDKEYAQNFIDEGLGPADIPYLHFGDLCRLIPNVKQRTLINACSRQMLETQDTRKKKKKGKKSKKKKTKKKKKNKTLRKTSGTDEEESRSESQTHVSFDVVDAKKEGKIDKFLNKLVRGHSADNLTQVNGPKDEEWSKLQAKRRRRTLSPTRLRSKSTPHGPPTDPSIPSQGVSQKTTKSQRKRSVTVGDDNEDSKQSATYERENSYSSQRSSGGVGGVQYLRNHNVQMPGQNSRMVLSIEDHPEYNTELVRLAKEQNVVIVTVKTTDAAVEFFRTNHDSTLDPSRFRVMTCMTRETEPFFSRKKAGAEVIKKFHRMGYRGPMLVYSDSFSKAQHKLAKYNISSSTYNIVISDSFQRTLDFCTFSDVDQTLDNQNLDEQRELSIANTLRMYSSPYEG